MKNNAQKNLCFHSKRAQLTLYMIIAAIIVAAVIFFYVSAPTQLKKTAGTKENVNSFINDCAKKTAENSLLVIGGQGGYSIAPSYSFENITLFFDDGKDLTPSKQTLENELAKTFDEIFGFCINDFANFEGINFSYNKSQTKATIMKEEVVFDVIYPVTLKIEDESESLLNFQTTIPLRLQVMRDIAENFTDEQIKNATFLPIGYLNEMAYANDFWVEIKNRENNTAIIILTDQNYKINYVNYAFTFAGKYQT